MFFLINCNDKNSKNDTFELGVHFISVLCVYVCVKQKVLIGIQLTKTFCFIDNIVLIITVSVATVNLTPASILSIAGQTMKLTCTTSYCNPPANIMWYLSSKDITNQSKPTVQTDMDLVSTISLLQRRVDKRDNKKQVYCTARNSPGRTVNSTLRIVSVLCKYIQFYTYKTVTQRSNITFQKT